MLNGIARLPETIRKIDRLKIRKRQKTRNSYNFKMSNDLGTWEAKAGRSLKLRPACVLPHEDQV